MIYAFDTYYFEDKARTACVAFHEWEDEQPAATYVRFRTDVEEYESGEFFRRELPCIMDVLDEIKPTDKDIIVVDGYVILNDDGKPGLGSYVYEKLGGSIPVIGVAKNLFNQPNNQRMALVRGESKKPLYVTAKGIGLQEAYDSITRMHGEYRIPTLLKLMDQLSRGDE